jgi:hypothetical protein
VISGDIPFPQTCVSGCHRTLRRPGESLKILDHAATLLGIFSDGVAELYLRGGDLSAPSAGDEPAPDRIP